MTEEAPMRDAKKQLNRTSGNLGRSTVRVPTRHLPRQSHFSAVEALASRKYILKQTHAVKENYESALLIVCAPFSPYPSEVEKW